MRGRAHANARSPVESGWSGNRRRCRQRWYLRSDQRRSMTGLSELDAAGRRRRAQGTSPRADRRNRRIVPRAAWRAGVLATAAGGRLPSRPSSTRCAVRAQADSWKRNLCGRHGHGRGIGFVALARLIHPAAERELYPQQESASHGQTPLSGAQAPIPGLRRAGSRAQGAAQARGCAVRTFRSLSATCTAIRTSGSSRSSPSASAACLSR